MIAFWRNKQLRKRLLFAIAIPYTEEQFNYLCQRKDSDFINSMKSELNCLTDEELWDAYKETARLIETTIEEMRNLGAIIIDRLVLADLSMMKDVDITIIVAHNNNTSNKIEMYDGLKYHNEFVESLPTDYSGWLDLSCCNSDGLLSLVRMRFKNPDAHIVATTINTSLSFRMELYTFIAKKLCKRPNLSYIDALKSAQNNKKMFKTKFKAGSENVHLGNNSIINIPRQTDSKCNVFSSIFAPSEISCKSHMLIQVYLHLFEEMEEVNAKALKCQPQAQQRDFIPLQYQLDKGDHVDIELSIIGESLLFADKKSIVWHGSYAKCSFCYFVPDGLGVESICCTAILSINGALVGEMQFVTKIKQHPTNQNSEVFPKQYKKIFISYAHEDESQVRPYAMAYKTENRDYFYDRDYLKAGDVFMQEIKNYIDSADLFLLFWSENAAKSKYVQFECEQALQRAYPRIQPPEKARIRICPMIIEPRAELPNDLQNYQYEEIK